VRGRDTLVLLCVLCVLLLNPRSQRCRCGGYATLFCYQHWTFGVVPLKIAAMQPFQIIFNPTSAAELAKMPRDLQLHILGQFRGLPKELQREDSHFGNLTREGRTLTRYRLGDYRVYFERHPLGIVVHRILSKNTLRDFLFRSNLPLGEDEQLQDNPKFWEMIEQTRSPSDPG